MTDPALQLKLRKRLETLIKLPENLLCADCKKRGKKFKFSIIA